MCVETCAKTNLNSTRLLSTCCRAARCSDRSSGQIDMRCASTSIHVFGLAPPLPWEKRVGSILGCALPFLVCLQVSKQCLWNWDLAFFFVLRFESRLRLGSDSDYIVLEINITPS